MIRLCDRLDTCQRVKEPIPPKSAPMLVARSGYPKERISVKVLGELPVTERDNRYVLVVSDHFIKLTESHPMSNMEDEASTVAKLLIEQLFLRFGIPDQIYLDQGRQFESIFFWLKCVTCYTLIKPGQPHTTLRPMVYLRGLIKLYVQFFWLT